MEGVGQRLSNPQNDEKYFQAVLWPRYGEGLAVLPEKIGGGLGGVELGVGVDKNNVASRGFAMPA